MRPSGRILRRDRAPTWESLHENTAEFLDMDTFPPGITELRHPKWGMNSEERETWKVHLDASYGPVELRPENPLRFAGEAIRESLPELQPMRPLNAAAAAAKAAASAAEAGPSPAIPTPPPAPSASASLPAGSSSTPTTAVAATRTSTGGKAGTNPPKWAKAASAAPAPKAKAAASGASGSKTRAAAAGSGVPVPKRPRRGLNAADNTAAPLVIEPEVPAPPGPADEPTAPPTDDPPRKKKVMPRPKARKNQAGATAGTSSVAQEPAAAAPATPPPALSADDLSTAKWVPPPTPPAVRPLKSYNLAIGIARRRKENPWQPNFNPQSVSGFILRRGAR